MSPEIHDAWDWNLKEATKKGFSMNYPEGTIEEHVILKKMILEDINTTPIENDINAQITLYIENTIVPILNKRFGF